VGRHEALARRQGLRPEVRLSGRRVLPLRHRDHELPCGLLYSALIAAAARGGAIEGAAALALFGIGTAPALLGVSVADELLARNRAVINRLSQVFLLAMGTWFLWTGFAGRS
jgi:sulfite exporter TauE/SafE